MTSRVDLPPCLSWTYHQPIPLFQTILPLHLQVMLARTVLIFWIRTKTWNFFAVEDEQAYNTKVDSCSEDSDVGEDDSCKKVMSPFFKKSLQMQPSHCQQSKLKIDQVTYSKYVFTSLYLSNLHNQMLQLKKQCLRQNVHQRLRRSSLSSESASNNWKHVVAASQGSS